MATSLVDRRPEFSVGLEIHARLRTPTKLFCTCANLYGADPNTLTCPVCLGMPGTLPVLSNDAVALAVRVGLACGSRIASVSEFARKAYFYPDLPRNYQITQFDRPICFGGDLPGPDKLIALRRIHLEEDAGRTLDENNGQVRVDLNRAGTPLIEVVTEPDLTNGNEAREVLRYLRRLLQYLDVCDGNMAQGSLRCDANVGLKDDRRTGAGPMTEIKNLNSLKAVAHAVDYEICRLGEKLAVGQPPERQTRSWDAVAGCTVFLRSKEAAHDYRYFPEPDLPLLSVSEDLVAVQSARMPELPIVRQTRMQRQYDLTSEDAVTICENRELANRFEACVERVQSQLPSETAKTIGPSACAMIRTEMLRLVAETGRLLADLPVSWDQLADLLFCRLDDQISHKAAKQLFTELAHRSAKTVVAELIIELDLALVTDPARIKAWCARVVADHPQKSDQLRQGKVGLLDFFIGRALAASAGKASPQLVNREMRRIFSL